MKQGSSAPSSASALHTEAWHLNAEELEEGLSEILRSPKDEGLVALIVRRPEVDRREVLEEGHLDLDEGLVGDNWKTKGSSKTPDGSSHPLMQLNLMNSRVIAHIAQDPARRQLAGDQLHADEATGVIFPKEILQLGSVAVEGHGEVRVAVHELRDRQGERSEVQAPVMLIDADVQRVAVQGVGGGVDLEVGFRPAGLGGGEVTPH